MTSNIKLRTKWISEKPLLPKSLLSILGVPENILEKGVSLKPNKGYKD